MAASALNRKPVICGLIFRFDLLNPIRTEGGGGGGCFPPGSRFFANNFGSSEGTQSKLGDFS